MKLHISHGADPDDWFVVKPLEGESSMSVSGTPITHEMVVESLLDAGRRVYELDLTDANFSAGSVVKAGPSSPRPQMPAVSSNAAAFAAIESIQAGEWDRFLVRLQGAIKVRMRTGEWENHIVAGASDNA